MKMGLEQRGERSFAVRQWMKLVLAIENASLMLAPACFIGAKVCWSLQLFEELEGAESTRAKSSMYENKMPCGMHL